MGSGPTEQIKRTMMDMMNVRIPAGFGMAIASAADSSITAHISPDTWPPGSTTNAKIS